MNDFLIENTSFITKLFEIVAAISGSIYLRQTKNEKIRIFVYYLWLTVIVETIGGYKSLLQNNYDYEWFINIKNSVFCQNSWLYNIYTFLAVGLIGIFYSNLMSTQIYKVLIRGTFILYSLFSLIFFSFTDAFFVMSLPYDLILATVIICFYVVLYFLELMKSDFILKFYTLASFYISVGLMLWHICVTPLFIFDNYFIPINTNFYEFRTLLLAYINIFTYSCFAFGFWYSLKMSKQ